VASWINKILKSPMAYREQRLSARGLPMATSVQTSAGSHPDLIR
jgi:hypothetical protein